MNSRSSLCSQNRFDVMTKRPSRSVGTCRSGRWRPTVQIFAPGPRRAIASTSGHIWSRKASTATCQPVRRLRYPMASVSFSRAPAGSSSGLTSGRRSRDRAGELDRRGAVRAAQQPTDLAAADLLGLPHLDS